MIGGEHDYRHIVGHKEDEEPEAFTVDLHGWRKALPDDHSGPDQVVVVDREEAISTIAYVIDKWCTGGGENDWKAAELAVDALSTQEAQDE